jgi:hypothetical protein
MATNITTLTSYYCEWNNILPSKKCQKKKKFRASNKKIKVAQNKTVHCINSDKEFRINMKCLLVASIELLYCDPDSRLRKNLLHNSMRPWSSDHANKRV